MPSAFALRAIGLKSNTHPKQVEENYSRFRSIVRNPTLPTIMSSDAKKADRSPSAEQKRHESEEQLSLLQTITTELTTAEDLSSALEVVLRDVCEKTGWVLGHAWVPNPRANCP